MDASQQNPGDFFEALFGNAKQNCILVIDPDGIITEINPAFLSSFGYERKDLLGKYLSMLFTEEDQQKGLPERELTTVLREGRASDNNYMVNKDKTITWVAGESVKVTLGDGKNKILKVIQNIHQQKVSEMELRLMNDLNEDILKSIQDVVIVLDKNMNCIKTNNAFFKLFKKEKVEFETLNFPEYFKDYDFNGVVIGNAEDAIKLQKAISLTDIEIMTAAGEKRIFSLHCMPILDSSKKNVTVILHDITVYKQIEREREDIIGFVAHELRNPLANVMLANELMTESLKENKPDDVLSMLQRSKNNVMRLHRMIAELYDATKAKSGNFNLELTSINLGELIKEAIDTVQVLQPAYHIEVKGDMATTVRADKYRLIQVITNYLSNGIKYSEGKQDVELHVQARDNHVIVAVKDQGLGIPSSQLPYIFDKFFRAEKTRNIEGVGLGLYLCRQIIEAHKGQVWVESQEGKGSTFYFSIPKA